MQRLGVLIVERAVTHNSFYPDDLDLSWIHTADRGTIGNAFRVLMKSGIIMQTGLYRRSHSGTRNGSVIWQYRLDSLAKAQTFLARNKSSVRPVERQPDLLTLPTPFPK